MTRLDSLSAFARTRVYLTHIEDCSQATQRRKRLHEDVMYELSNYLVNMRSFV